MRCSTRAGAPEGRAADVDSAMCSACAVRSLGRWWCAGRRHRCPGQTTTVYEPTPTGLALRPSGPAAQRAPPARPARPSRSAGRSDPSRTAWPRPRPRPDAASSLAPMPPSGPTTTSTPRSPAAVPRRGVGGVLVQHQGEAAASDAIGQSRAGRGSTRGTRLRRDCLAAALHLLSDLRPAFARPLAAPHPPCCATPATARPRRRRTSVADSMAISSRSPLASACTPTPPPCSPQPEAAAAHHPP